MFYTKQFAILDKVIKDMRELLNWEKEQNSECNKNPNMST